MLFENCVCLCVCVSMCVYVCVDLEIWDAKLSLSELHPNRRFRIVEQVPSTRGAAPGSLRRKKACARSAPCSPRGGAGSGRSYTFDYFGIAGQRGAWRGLEDVTAARWEVYTVISTYIYIFFSFCFSTWKTKEGCFLGNIVNVVFKRQIRGRNIENRL